MSFIDANIFMYAAGGDSPWRAPCQKLLTTVTRTSNPNDYFTSTEVLQEILHRYLAIGQRDIGFKLFDSILCLGITILPVEVSDVMRAKVLLSKYHNLSTRDAIHAGVMEGNAINTIISYDRDFSNISGLLRIEPTA